MVDYDNPIASLSEQSDGRLRATTQSAGPSFCQTGADKTDRNQHVSQLSPFVIKQHPSFCTEHGVTVFPLFIIPRARLPLYFLDTNNPTIYDTINHSRIFSANIPGSKEVSSDGNDYEAASEPVLIIAQLQDQQHYFAIEKVCQSIYSVLPLSHGACITTLRSWAISPQKFSNLESSHKRLQIPEPTTNWWSNALLDISLSDQPGNAYLPTPKRRKLDASSSDSDRVQNATNLDASISTSKEGYSSANDRDASSDLPSLDKVKLEDLQATLVMQYVDNLYCSKAPVTYFAKSSISRARAVATKHNDLLSLASYLRSLVLTVPTIDQKYKITIPGIVESIPRSSEVNTDPTLQCKVKNTKRKKSKKWKPQKNGLFPGEQDTIEAWWSNVNTTPSATEESISHSVMEHLIGKLRFRETLLQLVLILETLYTESSILIADKKSPRYPENHDTEALNVSSASPQQSKRKNPRDFCKLIDILIDRMLIWQSVNAGEDFQKIKHNGNRAVQGSQADLHLVGDKLKDFYVQLVAPFYGSRLPNVVSHMGKKLGISSGLLKQPTTAANASNLAKVIPGTQILRRSIPKERKSPSQKSSHGVKSKVRKHPSLLRSVTDTALFKNDFDLDKIDKDSPIGAKDAHRRSISRSDSVSRDGSSSRPLSRSSSISHLDGSQRPLSRSNSISLTNQSLKQREVDLSAIAKFNKSKHRKPNVEQELKEAISAIKKPNRSLAGQDFMDAMEERVASTGVGTSIVPCKRIAPTGVEVSSTPKRSSKIQREVYATPHRTALYNKDTNKYLDIPSPMSLVPSSAIRDASRGTIGRSENQKTALITMTPAKKLQHTSVVETPTRRDRLGARSLLHADPNSINRQAQTPRTQHIPTDDPSCAVSNEEADHLNRSNDRYPHEIYIADQSEDEQGVKENLPVMSCSPVKTPRNNGELCIYDALGWDDDIDELA